MPLHHVPKDSHIHAEIAAHNIAMNADLKLWRETHDYDASTALGIETYHLAFSEFALLAIQEGSGWKKKISQARFRRLMAPVPSKNSDRHRRQSRWQ